MKICCEDGKWLELAECRVHIINSVEVFGFLRPKCFHVSVQLQFRRVLDPEATKTEEYCA